MTTFKKKYTSPDIEQIKVDKDISLQLQSAPPTLPWEGPSAPAGMPGFGF